MDTPGRRWSRHATAASVVLYVLFLVWLFVYAEDTRVILQERGVGNAALVAHAAPLAAATASLPLVVGFWSVLGLPVLAGVASLANVARPMRRALRSLAVACLGLLTLLLFPAGAFLLPSIGLLVLAETVDADGPPAAAPIGPPGGDLTDPAGGDPT